MENLITDDRGWEGLESDFVARVVEIIGAFSPFLCAEVMKLKTY